MLNALKKVFYDPPGDEQCDCDPQTGDYLDIPGGGGGGTGGGADDGGQYSPRRTSAASSVSGYGSEGPDRDRSVSIDSTNAGSAAATTGFRYHHHQKCTPKRVLSTQLTNDDNSLSWIPEAPPPATTITEAKSCSSENVNHTAATGGGTAADDNHLAIPSTAIATSNSLDTLMESTLSGPSSPSNLSACTLVGSTGSGGADHNNRTSESKTSASMMTAATSLSSSASPPSTSDDTKEFKYGTAPTGPLPERRRSSTKVCVVAPVKEGIVTYALPPTVTTTHYCESPLSSRKNLLADDAGSPLNTRSRTPSISTSGCLLPHGKFLMDRRPSAGANIIPHAALCQHRHSLQLNGDTLLKVIKIII